MSSDALRSVNAHERFRHEDEKKYNKALSVLFQRADANKLTEDAIKACRHLDINPEELIQKTTDYFLNDNGQRVSAEIASVRFSHF